MRLDKGLGNGAYREDMTTCGFGSPNGITRHDGFDDRLVFDEGALRVIANVKLTP